ncbi:MAG: DUF4114 domain-containing protein [Alphaproteobacteria bacterium]|nr:MAG: DUF4114 domain-containing protein [Alphaproteobacteria bacterium]
MEHASGVGRADDQGDGPATVVTASQGSRQITIGEWFTTNAGGQLLLQADGSYDYRPPEHHTAVPFTGSGSAVLTWMGVDSEGQGWFRFRNPGDSDLDLSWDKYGTPGKTEFTAYANSDTFFPVGEYGPGTVRIFSNQEDQAIPGHNRTYDVGQQLQGGTAGVKAIGPSKTFELPATEEVFTYTIRDQDGDRSSSTLTIGNEVPVDPPPSLSVEVASPGGAEDTSIPLTLTTTTDGTITEVVIENLGGAALVAGGEPIGSYDAASNSWTLTAQDLEDAAERGGLRVQPMPDSDQDITDVKVTVTAADERGVTTTVTSEVDIRVDAVADAPLVAAENAIGVEGQAVNLRLGAALTDTDGSESLSVTVAASQAGEEVRFTLSAGTDNGDGTWTVAQSDLPGLKLTGVTKVGDTEVDTANFNTEAGGPIQLTLTGTATEAAGGSAVAVDTALVEIKNMLDPPTITVTTDSKPMSISETSIPWKLASESIFPYLQESKDINTINPGNNTPVNGVDMRNLTMQEDREVFVTFRDEGAGYKNTLGFAILDENGTFVRSEVIWSNASEQGGGGSLVADQSKVSLGVLNKGETLNFFLISDGFNKNNFNNFTNGQFVFKNTDGSAATIQSSKPDLWFVSNDPTKAAVKVQGSVVHSAAVDSDTSVANNNTNATNGTLDLNPDKVQHAISGASQANGEILVGFEDIIAGGFDKRPGDADYNDLIFRVEVGPATVRAMLPGSIATEVTITDPDAGQKMQSASVKLTGTGSNNSGDQLHFDPTARGLMEDHGITVTEVKDAAGKVVGFNLSGVADAEVYQDVLRGVQFTSDTPTAGLRQVDFQVTDDTGLNSQVHEVQIDVRNPDGSANPATPIVEAPVVDNSAAIQAYDDAQDADLAAIGFADPDTLDADGNTLATSAETGLNQDLAEQAATADAAADAAHLDLFLGAANPASTATVAGWLDTTAPGAPVPSEAGEAFLDTHVDQPAAPQPAAPSTDDPSQPPPTA